MTNTNFLVSIIVPTKNSSSTLDLCLNSIKYQSYKEIEIIVVDNNSSDETKKIASKYTDKIYNYGPERSAQTNYGVKKANGSLIYKVDSDFILDKDVVLECVSKINEGFDAIVVHNTPDITISWIAWVRKFEVDMYKYDITHSSARFVKKNIYEKIGGFNEKITAGEDYDFQNKLNRGGYRTGFIDAEALHLGEPKKLFPHLKKYFEYGADFINYEKENKEEAREQLSLFRSVYFKNWKKFILNPHISIIFFVYSFLKFFSGGLGFLFAHFKSKKS